MEKVIYSCNGGLGVILHNENEADFINHESIFVGDRLFLPGDMTDFMGMFIKPIRYAGLLIESESESRKIMCFHTGDDSDLFGKKSYYYCFYKISDSRIFNKYTENSGRDYNWINGQWK